MSAIFDQITRAREKGDFSEFVAAIPYARFLGVTLETKNGELLGRMKFADHLVGNPTLPALHGESAQ